MGPLKDVNVQTVIIFDDSTEDGDEVSNAKEGDDYQEGFSCLPVLMVTRFALTCGSKLCDNNREDGDEDDSVGRE